MRRLLRIIQIHNLSLHHQETKFKYSCLVFNSFLLFFFFLVTPYELMYYYYFQSDQRTLPLDIDNDVASNDSESSISGPRLSTALPRSIGEVANTDSRKNVTRSPQRTKSCAPEVSEYNPNCEILKHRIDHALNLWRSLQQKIVGTPFNKTYLLLDGANKFFEAITTNQAIDPSPLEILVAKYFDKANTFTSLQSSFSSCMAPQQHDKKLTEYKIQLDDQLKVEDELLAHGGALKDGLVNTNSKITELQEELKRLFTNKKELKASALENDEKLSSQKVIISNIREEISSVETSHTLSNADTKSLELLEQELRTACDELENYNWKY